MSIMINQTRIPFAHLFPNFAEYKNFYFFSSLFCNILITNLSKRRRLPLISVILIFELVIKISRSFNIFRAVKVISNFWPVVYGHMNVRVRVDVWRRRDGWFSTSKSPEAVAHRRNNDEDSRSDRFFNLYGEEPLLEANCEPRRSRASLDERYRSRWNENGAMVDFMFNKD